jgi:sortase (surface protein transpeptidase)
MNSTSDPTVTLISCYPYMVDKQRIVVFATLQNP